MTSRFSNGANKGICLALKMDLKGKVDIHLRSVNLFIALTYLYAAS